MIRYFVQLRQTIITMKMKCIETVRENDSSEGEASFNNSVNKDEVTVSCKLLEENPAHSSKDHKNESMGQEEEQVIISDSKSSRGYDFRKVRTSRNKAWLVVYIDLT